MQILLLFFLTIPLIEIYLLLKIGSIVGAAPTIFLVVSTAVIGAWLLRVQGFATFQRLQASLQKNQIPAQEMIEGPILLLGGALLLTPGFFTDIFGFACLIPASRRRMALYIMEKQIYTHIDPGAGPQQRSKQDVIEGEYRHDDD